LLCRRVKGVVDHCDGITTAAIPEAIHATVGRNGTGNIVRHLNRSTWRIGRIYLPYVDCSIAAAAHWGAVQDFVAINNVVGSIGNADATLPRVYERVAEELYAVRSGFRNQAAPGCAMPASDIVVSGDDAVGKTAGHTSAKIY
jgi:hypothetical protein